MIFRIARLLTHGSWIQIFETYFLLTLIFTYSKVRNSRIL